MFSNLEPNPPQTQFLVGGVCLSDFIERQKFEHVTVGLKNHGYCGLFDS